MSNLTSSRYEAMSAYQPPDATPTNNTLTSAILGAASAASTATQSVMYQVASTESTVDSAATDHMTEHIHGMHDFGTPVDVPDEEEVMIASMMNTMNQVGSSFAAESHRINTALGHNINMQAFVTGLASGFLAGKLFRGTTVVVQAASPYVQTAAAAATLL